MRKFLLVAAALVAAQVLFAQSLTLKIKKCYSAEYRKEQQKKNPGAETEQQFEQWMSAKIKQKRAIPGQDEIVDYPSLPVIFHVIHTGQAVGSGYNISQARIQAQLIQLNKDYANMSGSPYAAASKTGLQFCLAQYNPSGEALAQPGINRINATGAAYGLPPYSVDDFDSKVKAATYWDPTKYINIWVTEFDNSEGVLGYATFPSSSTLQGLDNAERNATAGVVIDYTTVGSQATPAASCGSNNVYGTGRTLTHELGHFFGLLHIWGDAHCGTDYCDDTPVHGTANFGTATHPKANSCGTADEMFENYMDYSDDRVLNTFTFNQAERMQVVMLNSTRRRQLPTSPAGCVATANAAKISFLPCNGALTISEQATVFASCPNYTDIKLFLNIEEKATGAATLSITTAGTATKGVDYEILTPGIEIAEGDQYKEVVVRVFDDGLVENNETVVIGYTITGNGVVANASQPQLFTLTIVDNDNITISQSSKTIFSQDFGTTGGNLPVGWTTYDLNGGSTNKWVVSANGGSGTTGQSLHITSNSTTKPLTYSTSSSSAHMVQTPLIGAAGLKKINLSFNYKVRGEWYEGDVYDYGKTMISLQGARTSVSDMYGLPTLVGTYNPNTGNTSTFTGSVNADIAYNQYNGSNFYINYYWENDDQGGSQPPLVIDDIVVTASYTKVESEPGHARQLDIAGTSRQYIVSQQDGEIIAALENSSAPVSCVTASIQEAGNGQADLLTSQGIFKRSGKVVGITTASGTTANYNLTLYYTIEELAIWADITQLKVMKVGDGVDLASTLVPGDFGILTPTISDKREDDGYVAFTVSATGFSQFFLVEPATALPLQFTNFTVSPAAGGANLVWQTRNEQSNKGFSVERSLDGKNFSAIGFVDGKGQSAAGDFSYSFTDKNLQPGVTYYYRLLQTDFNGTGAYTSIRSLLLPGMGNGIIVYPNPVTDFAHLVTGKSITASLTLLNISGKTVWSQPQKTIAGSVDIPMAHLPAGVYMLQLVQDGKPQTFKIVKH